MKTNGVTEESSTVDESAKDRIVLKRFQDALVLEKMSICISWCE